MAHDNVHRLQDTFLEHLQRKRTPVTIFLSNGVNVRLIREEPVSAITPSGSGMAGAKSVPVKS